MAIQAALADNEAAAGIVQCPTGVPVGCMATLAKLRGTSGQQGVIGTAVRIVAVGAVVCHRLVFPQHGATGLGVALVAVVVQGELLDSAFGEAAMGIVATGAGHIAACLDSHQWMVAALVKGGELVEVAAAASFDLLYWVAYGITGYMYLVAVSARQALDVVLVEVPGIIRFLQMTAQADGVL